MKGFEGNISSIYANLDIFPGIIFFGTYPNNDFKKDKRKLHGFEKQGKQLSIEANKKNINLIEVFSAQGANFIVSASDDQILIYMISEEGFDLVMEKDFSHADEKIVQIKPLIQDDEKGSWLIVGFEYGKVCILDLENDDVCDFIEIGKGEGKYILEILFPNKTQTIVVY